MTQEFRQPARKRHDSARQLPILSRTGIVWFLQLSGVRPSRVGPGWRYFWSQEVLFMWKQGALPT